MKYTTSTLALLLATVVLTSCSQSGFQTGQSSSTAPTNNTNSTDSTGTGGSGGSTTAPTNSLDQVNLQGRVDSSQAEYKNTLAFDFDKTRGEFIIMIPMPSGFIITPSGVFSKYPDISLSTLYDPTSGRMKLAVRIPLKYVIKGLQNQPPSSLPNGDVLPAMPQGNQELPSLALNFPQQGNTQVSLYIGVNAIGLFMTLPSNAAFPLQFTLPIKNADKTQTYGFLSYVPPKGQFPPGLFVSSIVPPKISKILEDYFHL